MAEKPPDEAIQQDTLPELLRVGKASGRGVSLEHLAAINRVLAEPYDYRAVGRKRLDRAFNRMRDSMKHMMWSADVYEMMGELDQLVRGDDSAIPDDREARSMFYGIATALELAFDLGQAAIAGRVDPSALARFRSGVEARRQGAKVSAAARRASAADWRAALEPHLRKHRISVRRGDPNWKSRRDVAEIAKKDVAEAAGREIAVETITDAIKEIERESSTRIEREPAQVTKSLGAALRIEELRVKLLKKQA
ncbi:MAG: hypothetical protein JO223_04285 [Hyphomicrobiales bacterium]|nr:hypothetical protein [Hyphomicrobiales bacterium]MBV8443455.1 hypothetical protein [Hyphomicrobiales bacterium]